MSESSGFQDNSINVNVNVSRIISMYVVYDKILDSSSRIAYANNDREAYAYSIQQINKKISEDDKYARDDFDIVFVGYFHTDSGLIEPAYRIIDDSVVSTFKEEVSKRRAKFLEDTKRIFNSVSAARF